MFGLDCAEAAFRALDPEAHFDRLVEEGARRDDGPVLTIRAGAAAILTAERTALNLLQRLSGVATLTARYVEAVQGTGATILDTRKTTPGLRLLEKAAVLAGGGANHRIGLFDAILIKENHAAMAGGVGAAVRLREQPRPASRSRSSAATWPRWTRPWRRGAPRVLLDNMSPAELRAAVDRIAGRAETEASGGIDLTTVREAAEAGVDYISVGALTHSAPALDLSLLLEATP